MGIMGAVSGIGVHLGSRAGVGLHRALTARQSTSGMDVDGCTCAPTAAAAVYDTWRGIFRGLPHPRDKISLTYVSCIGVNRGAFSLQKEGAPLQSASRPSANFKTTLETLVKLSLPPGRRGSGYRKPQHYDSPSCTFH